MLKKIVKIFDVLLLEVKTWLEDIFIKNLPGRIGNRMRSLYWSGRFRKCKSLVISCGCIITEPKDICIGEKVYIMHNCCLYAHHNGFIQIGDRVSINSNVQIGAAESGTIIIGNDVSIGPNVVIRASNHNYLSKDVPINRQGHSGGKIIIEDDVWIASNVVILPNVIIGRGAIIGAGAVVRANIPPYALAAGVPAKIIRENCRT